MFLNSERELWWFINRLLEGEFKVIFFSLPFIRPSFLHIIVMQFQPSKKTSFLLYASQALLYKTNSHEQFTKYTTSLLRTFLGNFFLDRQFNVPFLDSPLKIFVGNFIFRFNSNFQINLIIVLAYIEIKKFTIHLNDVFDLFEFKYHLRY